MLCELQGVYAACVLDGYFQVDRTTMNLRATRPVDLGVTETHLFESAFQLAYWIHVNKEIAFFIAEDAVDGLPTILNKQKKNRKPSAQLRGFFRWSERTRPIRKTVRLNDRQMLQWLVLKESESWERRTERGEGPYIPDEEDMIVRYIKHLALISTKRDSFYITLAVGSLLHQFDRRETRLFFDILTQSDSARMKDTNYIGKQRLEVLGRISERFDGLIETTNKPSEEKQFVTQPITGSILNLVRESLNRFTPWDTSCVIPHAFEITDIAGLYLSEPNLDENEEEIIAKNRIHTVMHPRCFSLLCERLSKYVASLPREDLDRRCNYDSLQKRLAVPKFFGFSHPSQRGNRFQSPDLSGEDYIRLRRTLDARGHRRKTFIPETISVYADNQLIRAFDSRVEKHANLLVRADSSFIEIRGEDRSGELVLATLPLSEEIIHNNFKQTISLSRGQKVTISHSRIEGKDSVNQLRLKVCYSDPIILRSLYRPLDLTSAIFKENNQVLSKLSLSRVWVSVGAISALIMALSIGWLTLSPSTLPPRVDFVEPRTGPSATPTAAVRNPSGTDVDEPQTNGKKNAAIAHANWSRNREAALRAILLEPTRSDNQVIDLSQNTLTLSLRAYNNSGQSYLLYRIRLTDEKGRWWSKELRAPKSGSSSYGYVLVLSILNRRAPEKPSYTLEIAARSQKGWERLGHLTLRTKK